jgi:hypothetical protein
MNNNPSKKRRRKGEGNGSIHWCTITKNGREYPQAYYHWQENGQKRTRYIPQKLLGEIQEAEVAKRSVMEILRLLGVAPSKLLGDNEIKASNSELLGDNRLTSNDLLGD